VDPATVRPWLFTVARNVVLDAARARQARPSEVFSDVSLVAEPTNDIDQMLRRHAVRRSLSELSPPHRNALIQAYYHDRSTQEAAEVLGIPEGTVKSRIHYGLRCLREASTMSMAEA
jgi:RNA polymerase sigma-70 factor (ECF subfamily)